MSDKEAPRPEHRPLREAGYEERGIGADLLTGFATGAGAGTATVVGHAVLNHFGRTPGSTQNPSPPSPGGTSGSGQPQDGQ